VNEVHGLMQEYGIVMPKGVAKFRQAVVGKLESEKDKLTPLSQEMFWQLVEEFAQFIAVCRRSKVVSMSPGRHRRDFRLCRR
jgi:hypothetical protein